MDLETNYGPFQQQIKGIAGKSTNMITSAFGKMGKAFAGAFISYPININYTFSSVLVSCMNEHVKAVISVAEYVIGTATYYNTVAFFGKIADYTALGGPEIVRCMMQSSF